MKDIINKYKEYKNISNTIIIITSLALAFLINFMMNGSSSLFKSLQTSVLNSSDVQNISDIFIENNNDILSVKTSKQMNSVKNISVSIAYNWENVKITNLNASNGWNVTKIDNEDGIISIIINFTAPITIKKNSNIVSFAPQKKENKTENLNLLNANFTTSEQETYLLSTSGINF